jgi:hypothetical protein
VDDAARAMIASLRLASPRMTARRTAASIAACFAMQLSLIYASCCAILFLPLSCRSGRGWPKAGRGCSFAINVFVPKFLYLNIYYVDHISRARHDINVAKPQYANSTRFQPVTSRFVLGGDLWIVVHGAIDFDGEFYLGHVKVKNERTYRMLPANSDAEIPSPQMFPEMQLGDGLVVP